MHADPVQAVIEAMAARLKLMHTDFRFAPALIPGRPLPALDEDAFDAAVGAFHRAYQYAFRPVLASEAQEAHDEATREALEAFLRTYTELVAR